MADWPYGYRDGKPCHAVTCPVKHADTLAECICGASVVAECQAAIRELLNDLREIQDMGRALMRRMGVYDD